MRTPGSRGRAEQEASCSPVTLAPLLQMRLAVAAREGLLVVVVHVGVVPTLPLGTLDVIGTNRRRR